MDNHSLVINSRREVLLRKNVLQGSGPSGLTRDTASLPKQGGLLAGGSATASGRASGQGVSAGYGAAPNAVASSGGRMISGTSAY